MGRPSFDDRRHLRRSFLFVKPLTCYSTVLNFFRLWSAVARLTCACAESICHHPAGCLSAVINHLSCSALICAVTRNTGLLPYKCTLVAVSPRLCESRVRGSDSLVFFWLSRFQFYYFTSYTRQVISFSRGSYCVRTLLNIYQDF